MKKIKIIESTDKEYPQKLLGIKDYPEKLYVIGNYELLNKKSIAIVGSRNSTPYGAKYAKEFAKKIAEKGICIVNGMAIGIDTSAHLRCIKRKRKNNCSTSEQDLITYIQKKIWNCLIK